MLGLSCRRLPPIRFVSLVILAFVLAGHGPASASVMWCRSDPLVVIDGYLVDVFVSVPIDQLLKVSGATEIVITTPPDVNIALASPGIGFGYGEHVTFAESPSLDVTGQGMQIRVKVLVPTSDDTVPVQVQLAPRIVGILSPTTVEGVANAWVSQRITI
ncbi:MAG TPA: hypothetical protein VH482_20930 [Thermomicrobiales bacterium]|jgi:hypothetical protein